MSISKKLLELEEQMEFRKKYMEYDGHNFKTYFSMYLIFLQDVCSEIDVIGKEIVSYFSIDFIGEKKTKSINR